jgi:hypothetical protein
MSQVAISGNASGTGTLTIASPNTNSNYTLTLPTNTGTLISTSSTGQVIPKAALPTGSVLQVVSTQITAKTTVSLTTAGTFYDISGFSVSITPTNANSKILFLAMVNQSYQTTGSNRQYLRIVRDSTAIGIGDVAGSQYRSTTGFYINDGLGQIALPLIWLDSPNTTSSTTYKVQVTTNSGSQTACFNRTAADNQNDMAVTASQILVLEIAA